MLGAMHKCECQTTRVNAKRPGPLLSTSAACRIVIGQNGKWCHWRAVPADHAFALESDMRWTVLPYLAFAQDRLAQHKANMRCCPIANLYHPWRDRIR